MLNNNALSRFVSVSIVSILCFSITIAADELKNEDEQISYSLGFITGENIKNQNKIGIQVSSNVFIDGFNDSIDNKKPKLTQEQLMKALTAMEKKHEKQVQPSLQQRSDLNLKKSQEFLAANKKKNNIIELKNGLQYQILASGDPSSNSPKLNDKVAVKYRGSLLNGTEFDSSYKKSDDPTIFELKSLIKGWQEALLLMKPKDKWKIFVPPELGYGTEGAGAHIEPNSLLIFEIELISINPS